MTVRFGRIGTDGQSKDKKLGSKAEAEEESEKLIREKLAKGYVATTGKSPPAAKQTNVSKEATSDIDAKLQAKVKKVLKATEMEEHAARVEKLIFPAIRIKAKGAKSVAPAASRFGGKPDLPKGHEWPTRDGVPMEFVAQIQLADAAPFDAKGLLPKKGSLLFFYNTQMESSDNVDDKERYDCAHVLYLADDSTLVRTDPPRVEYTDEFRPDGVIAPREYKLATLAFNAVLTLPTSPSAFLPTADAEALGDYEALAVAFDEAITKDWRGEYHDNKMLGRLPNGDYVDAMDKDDVLLMTVDSEGAADFQWGDCDHLYFVIASKDLAARRFERTRLYHIIG